MSGFLDYHHSAEGSLMIIVAESARPLKRFIAKTGLSSFAQSMMLKLMLTFIMHVGRMSCSQAAGSVASESVHRSQVTRFLARPRWQKEDFNAPLRDAILELEAMKGEFIFIIDATVVTQSGLKVGNTFSTGNRKKSAAHKKKGRRYGQKKVASKRCHSFTFGLLITPSGYRIPFQIPHYTKEYCKQKGIQHRSTAESAAELIRNLPLSEEADVIVLGDSAYEAKVVEQACNSRGYIWIFPANPERVYEGDAGNRPKLRSRLKDWTSLSHKTIRLRASTGKYAKYRRLSKWRVGPRQKPRAYYAYQEKREVRNVGHVQLVFSTMKPNLKNATPDDVKILMTNATGLSVSKVIELYAIRWQIELFFKELKSTLGFSQYSFQNFEAVKAWCEIAVATALFLEHTRAKKLTDRRISDTQRKWWEAQRLHGLCHAFRAECQSAELKYIEDRLKTSGGIQKLKRLINAAIPQEYRAAG